MKYRAAGIVVALTAFVCAAGLPLSAHAADPACKTNGPLVTSGFTFNGTDGGITVFAPSGTSPGKCSTSVGYTFGNTELGSLDVVLHQAGELRSSPAHQARTELNALAALADQYRLEHGDFPDVATWRRLADRKDPRFYDPWGRAYRYERTVDGVAIRTLGRDGVDGGMGMDADLSAHFSSAGSR